MGRPDTEAAAVQQPAGVAAKEKEHKLPTDFPKGVHSQNRPASVLDVRSNKRSTLLNLELGETVAQHHAKCCYQCALAGLRVLVVDDDPLCLKIIEQMLKHCNYEGTVAQLINVAAVYTTCPPVACLPPLVPYNSCNTDTHWRE